MEAEANGAPIQPGLDKNAFANLEEVFRCEPVVFRVPEASDPSLLIFRLGVLMFCPALDHRLLIQASAPHLRLEVADSITTLS